MITLENSNHLWVRNNEESLKYKKYIDIRKEKIQL